MNELLGHGSSHLDLLSAILGFSAASFLTGTGMLWIDRFHRLRWLPVLVMGALPSAAAVFAIGAPILISLVLPATFIMVTWSVGRRLPDFHPAGTTALVAGITLLGASTLWSIHFVATTTVDPLTRGLLLCGSGLLVALAPIGALQMYEINEVLWREQWRHPRDPLNAGDGRRPMVSIHVPTHAEPPEVVASTLRAPSALDYPEMEVIVLDNNTADPSLWQPVESLCRLLGPRFRFVHVEGLRGAKAGALNLALRYTAPEAEIIAVVDADYQVAPDFLERLVGHFDDPMIGFVQAPQAYRGWESRGYLRACNFEYAYPYRTIFVSRNERNAALTVGTMSLIRRATLEEAGGWAEWCVTEDSELAIRIHALGYSSVYLTEVFGTGLIPETFHGYRSQRFRWIFGNVQQLKRHWRLLLPGRLARSSHLTRAQKLHHLSHGLSAGSKGVALLAVPVGICAAASLSVHHEFVAVPRCLLFAGGAGLIGGIAWRVLLCQTALGCSLADMMRAGLAKSALSLTIASAGARGVLTQNMPWRRTSKFPCAPSVRRAIRSAVPELLSGAVVTGVGSLVLLRFPFRGLLAMLGVALVLDGVRYLAAPALAIRAERDLRREAEPSSSGFALLHLESHKVWGEVFLSGGVPWWPYSVQLVQTDGSGNRIEGGAIAGTVMTDSQGNCRTIVYQPHLPGAAAAFVCVDAASALVDVVAASFATHEVALT